MEKTVTGIGEILWDMLPEGKKLGGAPANFSYHVSQFGFRSHVVSAVGKDSYGDEIAEILSSRNIGSFLQRNDFPTGTVQVSLDHAGIPAYDIRRNVAWDNIVFTEELAELARNTDAVCFGSLAQRNPVSRQTILRFLDEMPDDGQRLRIFDINLRQNFYTKEIVETSMHRCDILKINDEELITIGRLTGQDTADTGDLCHELLSRYGLKLLILTCGADGSYVFSPSDISFIKTPEVSVADTVGAGDSFTASFVSGLMKGLTVRQAHRLAVDVSAFVCTQKGAMPEFPEHFRMMEGY